MKEICKIILLFLLIWTIFIQKVSADEKIKIGLLVPLSGQYSELGHSIVKATRMAINKINNKHIEVIPKDTRSSPEITLQSAKELGEQGIKIIIGPVFNENLVYLNELQNITFLSLSNKIDNGSKNIISSGINATSQLRAVKKFIHSNKIERTIFLTPDVNYKNEIKKAISQSKIKIIKNYIYDSSPTKLTNQIEEITNYKIRKQNLKDAIVKVENSNQNNKEKLIEKLKKRDTLGNVNFDALIIADFDQSLKSVTTSLLYTDVSPKDKYFITLNQWFDESLLNETSSQPIYFPSINKKNYEEFKNEFNSNFNQYPNELSFLSFDLVGLVYYLLFKNDLVVDKEIFKKKKYV